MEKRPAFFCRPGRRSVAKLSARRVLLGLVTAYYMFSENARRKKPKAAVHYRFLVFGIYGKGLYNMLTWDANAENSGMLSPTATKENPTAEVTSSQLYIKCVTCPDYGVRCNGPKLAAFQDISSVRAYHRILRDSRKIIMRQIYEITDKVISDATVKDYFSHADKDFRWTTVAQIDNALTAICGNRVGLPPLDSPCPATSSEISAMIAEETERRKSAESSCTALQTALDEQKQQHAYLLDRVRQENRGSVDYLKNQVEELKNEKRDYLKRIDTRNRGLVGLSVLCALLAVLLACYIVWDFLHVGQGLFWL